MSRTDELDAINDLVAAAASRMNRIRKAHQECPVWRYARRLKLRTELTQVYNEYLSLTDRQDRIFTKLYGEKSLWQ
jgi:hypothetical protein